jgi:hypothetical protein
MVRRNRRAYQVRECAEPSRCIKLAETEIDRALAPKKKRLVRPAR